MYPRTTKVILLEKLSRNEVYLRYINKFAVNSELKITDEISTLLNNYVRDISTDLFKIRNGFPDGSSDYCNVLRVRR